MIVCEKYFWHQIFQNLVFDIFRWNPPNVGAQIDRHTYVSVSIGSRNGLAPSILNFFFLETMQTFDTKRTKEKHQYTGLILFQFHTSSLKHMLLSNYCLFTMMYDSGHFDIFCNYNNTDELTFGVIQIDAIRVKLNDLWYMLNPPLVRIYSVTRVYTRERSIRPSGEAGSQLRSGRNSVPTTLDAK